MIDIDKLERRLKSREIYGSLITVDRAEILALIADLRRLRGGEHRKCPGKVVVETYENGKVLVSLVDDKNQVVSRITSATSTTSGSRTREEGRMKIVVETYENGKVLVSSLVDDKNQVVSRITSATSTTSGSRTRTGSTRSYPEERITDQLALTKEN